MFRCPGQDQRFWKPDDIFDVRCPDCGQSVEFFKDEPQIKCRKCGQMIVNPRIDLGCAQWCQYAEQCLGVTAGKQLTVIRDELIDEMKKVFAADKKRIGHTLAVLDYAEQIQKAEGSDPLVVKAAAILHDIGTHEAESKHGSSSAEYQEIERPIIVRRILAKYDLGSATVEYICRIIANHHSAKDINTIESRILWDADRLVNIPTDFADANKEKLEQIIENTFKTCKGRQIAIESFIKN